ncbi:MAG: polymerase sigma factor, sigma-70 family [Herbinix sp.]|jgi:RNA polymerase sigma-70 factor (ECF subfamily)|nr:polymerase sigma factor, sigma-70 family [Herbinix sp.]
MKAEDLLQYADMLLKTAIIKTHNIEEAQDLLQETYLCAMVALKKGAIITNPKAYLASILNNQYFLFLRKKYKMNVASYDDMCMELTDDTDAFEELYKTEEAVAIRRELAFLSHIYRDVMVRYYMQEQSVEQIAKELGLPKGTVLSRLDAGRKKVKKGVEQMDSYAKNSYLPDILTIGINGRTGLNGEPFSCIRSSLDQNILILTYEKPLTKDEISQALGVPAVFIEECVDYLVANQLMKYEGKKVFTDFVITTLKNDFKNIEISKKYAKETFDTANPIILEMVNEYKEITGFSACSDTYLYIMAILSIRQNYMSCISEAVEGKKHDIEDYPERPNYGKWIAIGSKYPNGYKFDDENARYAVSGRCGIDEISESIGKACEWNTAIGPTNQAKFRYSLSQKDRILAIDAVRTNTLNAFQAELIPDLEKYGFLKSEDGRKTAAVPYITVEDEKHFFEIEGTASHKYCSLLLQKAVDTVKDNIMKIPKHITHIPSFVYSEPLFYHPMAYIYEASERGVIELEDGKYYPIMYIVSR